MKLLNNLLIDWKLLTSIHEKNGFTAKYWFTLWIGVSTISIDQKPH